MNPDETIETLNELIETAKDGEYGFLSSAEYVRSPEVRKLFARRADECRQAAMELQTLVVALGGEAEDDGSTTGTVHRGWMAIKDTLSGYSDRAILEETERGEDSALSSYRKALEKPLAQEVRNVVEQQLQGVRRNHAQLRALRDQARATVD
jgi:uncharacterized protein (TIGR02284 family)